MATDLPQLKVGRYELIHEVGRGLSTVVYKAQDSLLRRVVALKTIDVPPAVLEAEGEEFRQRFFQEARIAGRLSHPGLVAVHDVGQDPGSGRLYIAFEYVEGRLLEAVAGAQPMPWREAFRISARIAEALQHAHANGVVHRGVSPSNVMIGASGDPKVLDFGLARWATAGLKMTTTGQFFGSPLYLSPEQVGGQVVDARSDIFSLGAVLYRLLTGRHAFAAKTTIAITRRIAEDDPAPPSSLVGSLPDGVDDLIRRALAKEPAHRYADARSMAADLDDVLSGRPPGHCRRIPRTADERPATPLEEATSAPPPITPVLAPADTVEPRLVEPAPDPKPLPVDHTWLPGEHTLLRRRASLRGVFGALLLAVVAVAHFARGTADDPAPVPVASPPLAGAVRATPPPLRSEAAEEDLEGAPADPGQWTSDQGDPARLVLDLEHPLQAGTVVVYVNGEKLLQRRLRAAVTDNILGFKLRRQRLRETVSLKPGKKRVLVQVFWRDGRRSKTIAGTFKPGATRRLSVRMGRVGKGLSLEWR